MGQAEHFEGPTAAPSEGDVITMNTRPRLVRSIPFWGLVVASGATLAYGVSLVADKLAIMTVTLTDGSATGVEVYVGQSVALLGSILVGVGVLGLLIALAVAAASTLRPHAPAEVVEQIDWDADDEKSAVEHDEPADAAEASDTTTAQPAVDSEQPVASR